MSPHLDEALAAPLTSDRSRVDFDRVRLVAARCDDCGRTVWPRRAVCASCGSGRMRETELPDRGVLQAWTRVWTPLPGVDTPYISALVDLSGVRIFGHLRGLASDVDPQPGTPVVLRVERGAAPYYWFVRDGES